MTGKRLPKIPEYYLHWTFLKPELLQQPCRTLEGLPLEIKHPGTPNPADGPDVSGTLLKIGPVLMRGDVEFHLRWQDWAAHGHADDPRYNQVILHGLWQPPEVSPLPLSRRFAHLVLSRHLKMPLEDWLKYMAGLEQDNCGLDQLKNPALSRSQLAAFAWSRFQRKCDRLRTWVEQYGWEAALYLGLGDALGYRHNSHPFREMIRQLPPHALTSRIHLLQQSPELFWVLYAWQSGLLNRPLFQPEGSVGTPFQREMQQAIANYGPLLPGRGHEIRQWRLGGSRPQNNPYFRLAGLCQLIHHYPAGSFFKTLLDTAGERMDLDCFLGGLQCRLRIPLSAGFAKLFREVCRFRQPPGYTLGKERCNQFILNILLPLFYEWARQYHHFGFQCYLEDVYFRFPAVDTSSGFCRSATVRPESAFLQQGRLEYFARKV